MSDFHIYVEIFIFVLGFLFGLKTRVAIVRDKERWAMRRAAFAYMKRRVMKGMSAQEALCTACDKFKLDRP